MRYRTADGLGPGRPRRPPRVPPRDTRPDQLICRELPLREMRADPAHGYVNSSRALERLSPAALAAWPRSAGSAAQASRAASRGSRASERASRRRAGAHHAARGAGARGHRVPGRDRPPLERGAAPLGMALEVSLDHAPDVVVAALEARGDRVPVLAVVGRDRRVGPDARMLERSRDELEVVADGEARVPRARGAYHGGGKEQRLDSHAEVPEHRLGGDPALEFARHGPHRPQLVVAEDGAPIRDDPSSRRSGARAAPCSQARRRRRRPRSGSAGRVRRRLRRCGPPRAPRAQPAPAGARDSRTSASSSSSGSGLPSSTTMSSSSQSAGRERCRPPVAASRDGAARPA